MRIIYGEKIDVELFVGIMVVSSSRLSEVKAIQDNNKS